MNSNAHLSEEELSAFLDGELCDTDRFVATVHLEQCDRCRAELARLREIVSLLHSLPQHEPPRSFALTPEQAWPTTASPPAMLRILPAVRLLSLAAVVTFLVVSGVVIYQVATGDEAPASESAPPTETNAGSGASEKATGNSGTGSNGVIERGDTASNQSIAGEPPGAPAPAGDQARQAAAQQSATPGAEETIGTTTPVAVAGTAIAKDDDRGSWLMTSAGFGAIALVLVGLWLVLVRMGRTYRRTA